MQPKLFLNACLVQPTEVSHSLDIATFRKYSNVFAFFKRNSLHFLRVKLEYRTLEKKLTKTTSKAYKSLGIAMPRFSTYSVMKDWTPAQSQLLVHDTTRRGYFTTFFFQVVLHAPDLLACPGMIRYRTTDSRLAQVIFKPPWRFTFFH